MIRFTLFVVLVTAFAACPPMRGDDGGVDAGTDDAGSDAGWCGNGVIELGESCDDGNTVSEDGCEPLCVGTCRNGRADPGEFCFETQVVAGDFSGKIYVTKLDGDALDDVLVVSWPKVTLWLSSAGGLVRGATFTVDGGEPSTLTRLNGSTCSSLVFSLGGTIGTLRCDSDAGFTSLISSPPQRAGWNPVAFTSGQFLAPGRTMLAALQNASAGQEVVATLLEEDGGAFLEGLAAPTSSAMPPVTLSAVSVRSGDFAGDPRDELITLASRVGPGVVSLSAEIVAPSFDGGFEVLASANSSGNFPGFALGDFDGDHRSDLLKTGRDSMNTVVLGGTLVSRTVGGAIPEVAAFVADFDRDGREDVALDGRVLRSADGGLLDELIKLPRPAFRDFAPFSGAGDFDGDGTTDLIRVVTQSDGGIAMELYFSRQW